MSCVEKRKDVEESQEKFAEVAVRLLATLSKVVQLANGFGGSILVELEKHCLLLFRYIIVLLPKISDICEQPSSDSVNFLSWAFDANEECSEIANTVRKFVDSIPFVRCVNSFSLEKSLKESAAVLENVTTNLFHWVAVVLPEVDVPKLEKRYNKSISAIFETLTAKREIRIRNWNESRSRDAILVQVKILFRLQLQREQLEHKLCLLHRTEQNSIRRRIECLHLDQHLRSDKLSVKLQPLAHSPRLINLKDIGKDTAQIMQERIFKYKEPTISVNTFNNADPRNRRHILFPSEPAEYRTDAFDEFYDGSLKENDLEQWRVLREIARLSFCSVSRLLKEIQSLDSQISGLNDSILREIASRHESITPKRSHFWVKVIGTPDYKEIPTAVGKGHFEKPTGKFLARSETEKLGQPSDEDTSEKIRRFICQALSIPGFLEAFEDCEEACKVGSSDVAAIIGPERSIIVNSIPNMTKDIIDGMIESKDVLEMLHILNCYFTYSPVVSIVGDGLAMIFTRHKDDSGEQCYQRKFVDEFGIALLNQVGLWHAMRLLEQKPTKTNSPDLQGSGDCTATESIFKALAVFAQQRHRFVIDSFLQSRSIPIYLWVLDKLFLFPGIVEAICTILCCIAEAKGGAGAIAESRACTRIATVMIRCPLRRSYQDSHLAACEALATAMSGEPENARQLAKELDRIGIRYLCEVPTRVPGHVGIYRIVSIAISRISELYSEELFVNENVGIKSLLYTIGRFGSEQSVLIHCLVALSHSIQFNPHKVGDIVNEGALVRVGELFDRKGSELQDQVLWRCFLLLSETVRHRDHCGIIVLEALRNGPIFLRLKYFLEKRISALVFAWGCIFMRYTLRSCVLKWELVAASWPDDPPVMEDSETHFDDSEVETKESAPEQVIREKGESLAAFFKRQAAANAVWAEAEKERLRIAREARLPPFEVRQAWASLFSHFHDVEICKAFVLRSHEFVMDSVASRESAKLFVTWLEADESFFLTNAKHLVGFCNSVLTIHFDSIPIVDPCCAMLHIIVELLQEQLPKINLDLQTAKAKNATQHHGFEAGSVFAELFESIQPPAVLQPKYPVAPEVEGILRVVQNTDIKGRLKVVRLHFDGKEIDGTDDLTRCCACLIGDIEKIELIVPFLDLPDWNSLHHNDDINT